MAGPPGEWQGTQLPEGVRDARGGAQTYMCGHTCVCLSKRAGERPGRAESSMTRGEKRRWS